MARMPVVPAASFWRYNGRNRSAMCSPMPTSTTIASNPAMLRRSARYSTSRDIFLQDLPALAPGKQWQRVAHRLVHDSHEISAKECLSFYFGQRIRRRLVLVAVEEKAGQFSAVHQQLCHPP